MGLTLGRDLVPAPGPSAPLRSTVGMPVRPSTPHPRRPAAFRRGEQLVLNETRSSGRWRRRGRLMASTLVLLASLLNVGPGTAATQAAGGELTVMTRNLSF